MAKFANVEEAKTALPQLREDAKAARKDLKSFCKENKLDYEVDHSADEKHGKKYGKLKKAVDSTKKAVESAEEFVSSNKPKKEKKERVSKYEYPADCTSAGDKKKFRAAQRAAAKRAEKGEKAEKAPKKDKAAKGEPDVVKKSDKKDKKDKKAKENVD